ncbi:MAG: hypothetical protein HY866_18055 [Chloroflexi bacterium]|nr:hypothetical protein [Chloroflexota bacterium]
MTPQSSHQGHDWETTVQETAKAFVYPPTPDLARHSEEWLPGAADMGRRRFVLRPAWGVLIVLIILAALLAVPQVRASILDALRIGAVQINLIEDDSPPDYIPLIVLGAPGQVLKGETTLDAARAALDYPIRLPPDLGAPDRVFMQSPGGPLVILVWNDPDDPARAALVLHIIGPGIHAIKSVPERITETTVNGTFAVWATGPYTLVYTSGEQDQGYLVEGNVLLWEQDGLTYRLESTLSLEEARRTAESLE